jgi:hypothetical protein
MAIVDDLLTHTGLYIGIDRDAGSDAQAAARILVTALPGGAGVTLDYEVFNHGNPDRVRAHAEHTVLARTHNGGAVMVIGHEHATSVAILRETEPGTFELRDEDAPFPMKVEVAMPEPGRLRHVWWYGPAGQEAVAHDIADVTRFA